MLTLKELADKYGYSESTVYKNFPIVQQNIMKKYDIYIEKIGRGKKAKFVESAKPEKQQLEDLKKFLEKNPALKEYFEGLEG